RRGRRRLRRTVRYRRRGRPRRPRATESTWSAAPAPWNRACGRFVQGSVPEREPGRDPMLRISPEKVCFIIFKARQFDAKVAPVVPDEGSNPVDESFFDVLEDIPDDPVVA